MHYDHILYVINKWSDILNHDNILLRLNAINVNFSSELAPMSIKHNVYDKEWIPMIAR